MEKLRNIKTVMMTRITSLLCRGDGRKGEVWYVPLSSSLGEVITKG